MTASNMDNGNRALHVIMVKKNPQYTGNQNEQWKLDLLWSRKLPLFPTHRGRLFMSYHGY